MAKDEKNANHEIVVKNSPSWCSYSNHLFESLYIIPVLGVIHPTQRINRKGKQLTRINFSFKKVNR